MNERLKTVIQWTIYIDYTGCFIYNYIIVS